jgi:aryl-alcohol dehydrogenase
MVSITAAVTREIDAPLSFEELELATPAPTEVLVRLVATGLCHTDVAVIKGHMPSPLPIVLGHEGAGIVVEVGDAVRDIEPGDRVALSYAYCGRCANCLTGRESSCEKFAFLNMAGRREDGATTLVDASGATVHGSYFGQSSFATHALIEARNVVKVPDDVPLELTGPLGCGIQTGAGTVLNALRIPAGSSLVVSGTGAVGLSAIMAARATGVTTIIAVDVLRSRLDTALELGATHAVNGQDPDVVEQILAIAGQGVQYAIDTTGIPAVLLNDIRATAFGGTIGVIGVAREGTTIPLGALSGKTFVGVVEGNSVPQVIVPQLMSLWSAGLFPFDRLITTYPFDQLDQAIEDTRTGAAVKAVVTF